MIHTPVLLKEVLAALNPQAGEFFIDGTLGGSGHARPIIERLGKGGLFLGIDRDPRAIEAFRVAALPASCRVILINDNFANLPDILKRENLGLADGLLLDLGLSSDQLGNSGRGFSFQKNEPLLMTFTDGEPAVKDLLVKLSEAELTEIIKNLSGERYASKIAREIKRTLARQPIATTFDFRETILRAVPERYKRGRLDPATRTFMALRIYANKELENLESLLGALTSILKPGGRLAIITFHSEEDRPVKNFLRDAARKRVVALLNKKVIKPSREEVLANPRSRSAKLRAAKIDRGLSPDALLSYSAKISSETKPKF